MQRQTGRETGAPAPKKAWTAWGLRSAQKLAGREKRQRYQVFRRTTGAPARGGCAVRSRRTACDKWYPNVTPTVMRGAQPQRDQWHSTSEPLTLSQRLNA